MGAAIGRPTYTVRCRHQCANKQAKGGQLFKGGVEYKKPIELLNIVAYAYQDVHVWSALRPGYLFQKP